MVVASVTVGAGWALLRFDSLDRKHYTLDLLSSTRRSCSRISPAFEWLGARGQRTKTHASSSPEHSSHSRTLQIIS